MQVVIVGGGASGALVAIAAGRHAPDADLTVIEPSPLLGVGVAYSSRNQRHLLNVRAAGMSALPDEPEHFTRWAGCEPDDYLPRHMYADYLDSLLPSHVVHQQVTAHSILRDQGQAVVVHSQGTTVADLVVLATGNGPVALPAGLVVTAEAAHLVDVDPWSPAAHAPAETGNPVVVLGSGLTAVDIAVSILDGSPDSRVVLLSRSGQLPRPHDNPWLPPHPTPAIEPRELAEGLTLEEAQARLAGPDWRQSIDSLRPRSHALWQALGERRTAFATEWLRRWDVHRHRMAPPVADRVSAWQTEGRLAVISGRPTLIDLTTRNGTAVVHLGSGISIDAQRVVVATGPSSSPSASPLLAALIASGHARPGPVGWGIDVDPSTLGVVDGRGRAQGDLLAVGPITRGVFLESTAIPDIRVQAATAAARIAAHPAR